MHCCSQIWYAYNISQFNFKSILLEVESYLELFCDRDKLRDCIRRVHFRLIDLSDIAWPQILYVKQIIG